MKCYSNNKAFSLIEVLISIAVLSFMVIGFNTIINDTAKNTTGITLEDRESFDLAISLDRIQKDYLHCFTPAFFQPQKQKSENSLYADNSTELNNFPKESEYGHLFPSFIYSPTSMQLFTSSNIRKVKDSKESEYAWVYYKLEKNESPVTPDAEFSLYRTFINTNIYAPELNIEDEKSYLLINNIKAFSIYKYDEAEANYEKITMEERPAIPYPQIKIVIEWYDRNQVLKEYEIILRHLYFKFDANEDKEETDKIIKQRIDEYNKKKKGKRKKVTTSLETEVNNEQY